MKIDDISKIEKEITDILDNCPCCHSKGICKFIDYGIDSLRFYVGCSSNECGLHVSETTPIITYDDKWKLETLKLQPRTPKEMAEIWNCNNNSKYNNNR